MKEALIKPIESIVLQEDENRIREESNELYLSITDTIKKGIPIQERTMDQYVDFAREKGKEPVLSKPYEEFHPSSALAVSIQMRFSLKECMGIGLPADEWIYSPCHKLFLVGDWHDISEKQKIIVNNHIKIEKKLTTGLCSKCEPLYRLELKNEKNYIDSLNN